MSYRILLITLSALVIAAPASAQIGIELRGGAAVGNYSPASSGFQTIGGPALATSIEYDRWYPLALYGGYSRVSFGCDDGFCDANRTTFTASGFSAGVRLHSNRLPWVRLGLLRFDVDADSESGGDFSLDPAFGYEVGTGFTVPLVGGVQLLPGLGYRHLSSEHAETSVVTAEVGLQVWFGR